MQHNPIGLCRRSSMSDLDGKMLHCVYLKPDDNKWVKCPMVYSQAETFQNCEYFLTPDQADGYQLAYLEMNRRKAVSDQRSMADAMNDFRRTEVGKPGPAKPGQTED